ncbi:MAG: helix-turn-helix transcriptional regulator [Acidobacteriota bacterium]|nr:winged helix-turn-helix domain-containing protein [Acidobacteriota bacterium]MDE3030349.1 helix-turn-helix transcriptional regulator [Acidobacteriota bacterium]MDE3094197.1 helix-turn-helix transcriptional regulator [Acidobacteriota bacterium]
MSVVDDVIGALDDPTRRALLDHLARRGTATATQLCAQVAISRQGVVQHLEVLARADLVGSERHGRERRYRLRTEALVATARWLEDLARDWDRRLLAIKEVAESP